MAKVMISLPDDLVPRRRRLVDELLASSAPHRGDSARHARELRRGR